MRSIVKRSPMERIAYSKSKVDLKSEKWYDRATRRLGFLPEESRTKRASAFYREPGMRRVAFRAGTVQ